MRGFWRTRSVLLVGIRWQEAKAFEEVCVCLSMWVLWACFSHSLKKEEGWLYCCIVFLFLYLIGSSFLWKAVW